MTVSLKSHIMIFSILFAHLLSQPEVLTSKNAKDHLFFLDSCFERVGPERFIVFGFKLAPEESLQLLPAFSSQREIFKNGATPLEISPKSC